MAAKTAWCGGGGALVLGSVLVAASVSLRMFLSNAVSFLLWEGCACVCCSMHADSVRITGIVELVCWNISGYPHEQ